MRRLFAWSVVCSLAVGCSESDTPVDPIADGGDTGAPDAVSDTGDWAIDSTVDSSEPDAADTSIDSADATAETSADADAMTADADAASPDADADASPGDADAADATGDADASPDATDASVGTELWVVRVGDDMATLDFAALPVSIDRVQVSSGTGTVVGSIALPTTPSGIEQAFTLPGSGSPGAGLLTRSSDGRFVTMAGYAAPVGTADIASSSTVDAPIVPRVVARIDGARTVSTSTTTTSFYDYSPVHSVVTDNGSRFWLAGFGDGIVYLGGFGSSVSGAFISTGARSVRSATLIEGAVYGVNLNAPRLFNFDGALPTAASTPVGLSGGPTTGSPTSMVGFARGTSGVDLLYVCDSLNLVDGGGLQRWTKTSGSWSRAATLAPTTTSGCHAIAGSFAGGLATLYVVTTEATASVVKFVDDPSSTAVPTGSLIMSATSKRAIRGIALAPTP